MGRARSAAPKSRPCSTHSSRRRSCGASNRKPTFGKPSTPRSSGRVPSHSRPPRNVSLALAPSYSIGSYTARGNPIGPPAHTAPRHTVSIKHRPSADGVQTGFGEDLHPAEIRLGLARLFLLEPKKQRLRLGWPRG